MKKTYNTPTITLSIFKTENIITTSGNGDTNGFANSDTNKKATAALNGNSVTAANTFTITL